MYYWSNMYTNIDVHVRTCNTCQRSKRNYRNDKATLNPMAIPIQTFSRPHIINVIGPLTDTSEKHKHIDLIVCALTGWCECFRVKTQDSILHAEILCRYGAKT